jgi:CDP-diacylglycerol--serine O-phosphatidyltransferase
VPPNKRKNRGHRRKAIYIFPNLFTTLSLFAGFYSIISSIHGRYVTAAFFILLAAIMDGLDGTVARMTNTTSRFGVEYDSLCDLLSFGAAPAVLVYLWALKPSQLHLWWFLPNPEDKTLSLGFVAAFIFLACGALRLARFNVSVGHRDPGFFQGLPIPGGAGLVAAAVLWHHRLADRIIAPNGPLILLLIIVLAFLMVSNFDFISHKNKIFLKNNRPFETLAFFIILLAFLIIKAKTVLFPLGFAYLISGPIITVIRKFSRKTQPDFNDLPDQTDLNDSAVESDQPASLEPNLDQFNTPDKEG